MPTYDSRNGQPVTAITVDLPDGLDVRRVIVRHSEVSLFDCEDRESVLIAQPGPMARKQVGQIDAALLAAIDADAERRS